MLDYMASRENFLEVGEQYVNHMSKNVMEWNKFVQFYSDTNNARKEKDEAYNREQYVGEELDWKMLADNLTLFGSQVENLKDLRGFEDPNDSIIHNQSISGGHPGDLGGNDNGPFDTNNISSVSYNRQPNHMQ